MKLTRRLFMPSSRGSCEKARIGEKEGNKCGECLHAGAERTCQDGRNARFSG